MNEWWMAVSLLALIVLLGVGPVARHSTLRMGSGALGLVALGVAGALAREPAGVGIAMYCALGLLTYWVGQVVFAELEEDASFPLAGGFVAGAVLQCAISAAQLKGASLGGLIMPKLYNAVYGNIAQPNHFGNLLWLGQASLIYLWGSLRLNTGAAVALSLSVSLFSAMSASRSVWLYTFCLPTLCLLYARYRSDEARVVRMARASLWVAAGSLLMQTLMAATDLGGWIGVVSSSSRVGDASSNGQRVFDWWVAWRSMQAYPWTGAGVGTFAWQTALHSVNIGPPDFIRIGENAHNTPLHLLAEVGWPLSLLVWGGFLWQAFGWWSRTIRAEALWAFLVLGVIGAHSLVEYPLWYVYFLVPAGLAAGILTGVENSNDGLRVSRRLMLVPAVALIVALVSSFRDYRLLEKAYARFPYGAEASDASFEDSRRIGAEISDWSLLAVHARSLQIRAWPTDRRDAAETITTLCARYLPLRPNFQTLTQCALAYAQTGREQEAAQAAAMVCGAYPAIYHGRFPTELGELFRLRGWPFQSGMFCIQ